MPNIRQYENPVAGLRPDERGVSAREMVARRGSALFQQAAGAVKELSRDTEQLGRETQALGRETQAYGRESENVGKQIGGMVARGIRDATSVAVDYIQNREISQGTLADAKLTAGVTAAWNDIANRADPNDPTVAAKFLEELEPQLDKFKSGFMTEGGQAFAERKVAALRSHMFEKTTADMAGLAAKAVETNIRETANTLSNTALSDPSAVPHLLSSVDSSIADLINGSPNLRGAAAAKARIEVAEKTKEAIVKAGAIGAIQMSANPERTAEEWAERYKKYINGAEFKVLAGNARQQIRVREQDYQLNRRRIKEEATERSNEATSQYLIDIRSKDPRIANDPTAVKILNDKTLLKSDKNNLLNLIDRQLKPETESRMSKQTFVELLRDMRAETDQNALMQKAWDARLKDPGQPGSMTESDFLAFRKEVQDRRTPEGLALASDRDEFFKKYAPAIDPSMGDVRSMQFGHHSALGQQKMYEARVAAKRMEEDMRKAGKDPHSIYDPNSPDFFGKPDNLMKYRASLQESQRYQDQISFKPPATWEFSQGRQQYRDPATKKIYDLTGKEVK